MNTPTIFDDRDFKALVQLVLDRGPAIDDDPTGQHDLEERVASLADRYGIEADVVYDCVAGATWGQ